MHRKTLFAVFLLGALTIGFLTFRQLMAAVWGAPTHPLQHVALYSSLGLFASAFVCLLTPSQGRIFATLSILGMGALYIPGAASLVPGATRGISTKICLLLCGYFALLAFALFFPTRWRVSVPIFAACLLASVAFAATTYQQRKEQGELHWPLIVCFQWVPSSEPLQVQNDSDGWLTTETRKVLSEHGITGVLRWAGSDGSILKSHCVIVICRSRIPAPKKLHYPKQGTVIYLFDGTDWKSIPAQPDVYPAHATLCPDGGLEQTTTGGGTQRSAPFYWF